MRFFLGMGAAKAGTSWVYEYLRRYPNVDFGVRKEYHVWSARDLENYRHLLIADPEQLVQRLDDGRKVLSAPSFIRFQMQQRDGAYESYFRRLIDAGVDSTGDLSPSYSDLPASSLERIRSRLEGVGFQVQPIFLMRDPFERIWSGVRMNKRKGKLEGADEELLRARLANATGSNYIRTVTELERVFAPDEVHYGIYEEMFAPAEIERLSRFCGVEPDVAFGHTHVNISPKQERVSADLEADIRRRFAGVYEYCGERFPQTRHLWRQPT